jgi:hypothetical protein
MYVFLTVQANILHWAMFSGSLVDSYPEKMRNFRPDPVRGRHLKSYSVIAITLRYVFALSYNVLTL